MWDQLIPTLVGAAMTDDTAPDFPTIVVDARVDPLMIYLDGMDWNASIRRDIAAIDPHPTDPETFRIFDSRYGSLSFTVTRSTHARNSLPED